MALQYRDAGPVDCRKDEKFGQLLKGKTVLITGGSSGLGYAYVKAFSDAGAIVIDADLKPPPEDVKLPNVHFVKCDVREWEDQKFAVKTAASRSSNGFVDIFVANAGISGDDPFLMNLDAPDIQAPDMRIVHVNLLGAMYTTRLALNHFKLHPDIQPQDKCLILKSSLAGYLDARPSYGSAKFGLRAVMRSLRHMGICRVNIVAPWFIHTPIMSDEIAKILDKQLKAQRSSWALIEDSVHCVRRIATDTSIHGRSFGIVPRSVADSGYVDLAQDDFQPGTMCYDLQQTILKLSHRK